MGIVNALKVERNTPPDYPFVTVVAAYFDGDLLFEAQMFDQRTFPEFEHVATVFWEMRNNERKDTHSFIPEADLNFLLRFYSTLNRAKFEAKPKEHTGIYAQFFPPRKVDYWEKGLPLECLANDASILRSRPHFNHLGFLRIDAPYSSLMVMGSSQTDQRFPLKGQLQVMSHVDISETVAAFLKESTGSPIDVNELQRELRAV